MNFTKEELANEIWKDVVGYNGVYQVSNLGRVKNTRLNKLVKITRCGNYEQVGLFLREKGRQITHLVHRVVLTAFVDNPDNLPFVNYKDEDKYNNRVNNLEWCDGFYNNNYGTKNDRMLKTRVRKKTKTAPKKVAQFDLEGNFIKIYDSLHDADRQTIADYRNIYMCCKGRISQHKGFIWRYVEDIVHEENFLKNRLK